MAISAGMALMSTASVAMTTGSFILGSALSHFLVTTAIGAAINALTPKPTATPSGYNVTQTGSALDHQIIYGRTKVAGVRVFDGTTGETNTYLHRVLAFAGHEIESYDQLWINDALVTGLDVDGNISEVTLPDGSTSTRYSGYVRIKKHLGATDQIADPDLVSEVSDWTTDHRLRGIAYLYVRLKFNADVFPNGVPEITAVIKGKKVYNPVTDTVSWTDNPALCIRDYLVSGYGLNEDTANIDETLFSTAAGICDQTNTLSGSTRFTCNGAFTTGATPYDTLQALLSSMGGLLWYAQGKWRVKPSYWTTPVASFDNDDLRSAINISTRHSRRDNYNQVNGTFRGEESDWQITDFPPIVNSAFVSADNGQDSSIDLSLLFTDNSEEARRLARINLERNRQQLTIQASFGLRAFQVQVGDNITLTNSRFGWSNKPFEVVNWVFGLTGDYELQVQMTLREISANVFDEFDDGEIYERDNTDLLSSYYVPTPVLSTPVTSSFINEDGTSVSSIKFSWAVSDSSLVDFFEFQWKLSSDTTWNSVIVRDSTEYVLSPTLSLSDYEYRVRAVNHVGISSPWASSVSPVSSADDTTAPDAPTSVSAFGGFKIITLKWENPPQKDFSHVEVYENSSNTTSGAAFVGSISGDSFVRTNLGLSVTKWYFLKAVDYTGNKSNFTSGVSATTTYLDDPDFENGIYSLFTDQGLYAIRDVSGLPVSGAFNGEKVYNTIDGQMYSWNATTSTWDSIIPEVGSIDFSDLTGTLANNQVLVNSIDGTKITDSSITTNQIAARTIQAGDIVSGTISANEIASNTITGNNIAGNTITGTNIAGSTITGNKIVANTITGGLLATSGIITNSAQINDALITNAKIQDAAITNAKIQSAAVDTLTIAGQAVTLFRQSIGSSRSLSGQTYQSVVSMTFNPYDSTNFLCWISALGQMNAATEETGSLWWRLLWRGSVIIGPFPLIGTGNNILVQERLVDFIAPASGGTSSGTLDLQMSVQGTAPRQGYVYTPTLTVGEWKR